MISAITKSPFSSLKVAFAVLTAPWVIRQLLPENTLRDILPLFPANAVNVQEVLLLPVYEQSIYYHRALAPAVGILLFAVLGVFFFGFMAYRGFKGHQVTE